MVRNLPQSGLVEQFGWLFLNMDFISLDIAGLTMSASSCIYQNSGSITSKLALAIMLPWIVTVCVFAHNMNRVRKLRATHADYVSRTGDLQLVHDEENFQQTHLIQSMLGLVQSGKDLTVNDILTSAEKEMTVRLFTSYDDDGGGTCSVKEMRMFCDHLGIKTTQEMTFLLPVLRAIAGCEGQDDPQLKCDHFLVFVAVYRQAMNDLHPDQECEIYPVGGKAWLHDMTLRVWGKMWKNIVLTQYLLAPPTTALCCSVFVCDPQTSTGQPDTRLRGLSLMRADYSVSCTSDMYTSIMLAGAVGVFIYAVFIPACWF